MQRTQWAHAHVPLISRGVGRPGRQLVFNDLKKEHAMKRFFTILKAVALGLSISAVLLASGGAKCHSYRGWVTDSECGRAGASPSHTRAHVEQVLSRGGQVLFFVPATDELLPIADPVAALEHVGVETTIDAHVEIVIHKYTASAGQ